MKITNINITKLFGLYDYDLDLFTGERELTILHAVNGRGKTTIMKLVTAVLTGEMLYIDITPFKEFTLTFDNGKSITVTKGDKNETQPYSFFDQLADDYFMNPSRKDIQLNIYFKFSDEEYGECPVVLADSYEIIRNAYITATKRGRFLREYNAENTSSYTLYELRKFFDRRLEDPTINNIIAKFTCYTNVKFIKSSRIFVDTNSEQNLSNVVRAEQKIENIRVCSNALAKRMDEAKRAMEDESERLDHDFPTSLLEEFKSDSLKPTYKDVKSIRKELKNINAQRRKLSNYGFFAKDEDNYKNDLANEAIPLKCKPILRLYIDNSKKKLIKLKDIQDNIELYLDIINNRNGLTNKKLNVNVKNGLVFEPNNIKLEKLSSGEKNLLILYYKLIFDTPKGSIVFIDEPEISLHIAWQSKYINQMLDICKQIGIQMIIATHSPDIINSYTYFMADMLKKEEDNNGDE